MPVCYRRLWAQDPLSRLQLGLPLLECPASLFLHFADAEHNALTGMEKLYLHQHYEVVVVARFYDSICFKEYILHSIKICNDSYYKVATFSKLSWAQSHGSVI